MSNVPSATTPDGGDLFDLGQGKLWAGFVLRSIRRHRLAFAATFLTIAALGSLMALSAPKQFQASTRLLVRNDNQINGITVPGSKQGESFEQPSLLTEPTIKSQANLEKIVDTLDLVSRQTIAQTSVGRFLAKLTGGGSDPKKKRDDVVNQLRAALNVDTTSADKQTVDAWVIWSDPLVAKEIIDAVNKNYFADRKTAEVGLVNEAKRIAQEQLAAQSEKVNQLRVQLGIPVDDQKLLPESSPLKGELAIEQEYSKRVFDAETQLKNTETAFGYRYQIVTPPEIPEAPVSGRLKSLLVSMIGAGIVAAGITTLLDVLRGRVVEPWQAARRLNLPVLAQLPG